jgi:tagatose 1,6-diphosphate aldolase
MAGPYRDDDLILALRALVPADLERGWVPYYHLDMQVGGAVAGRILLRTEHSHFLDHYAGQIGYTVEPAYRSHRYAARAVPLVQPLAREIGFSTRWITCDPIKEASRRSAELAGATYVETVPLPPDSDMYQAGDRERCRFRLDL